MEDETSTLCLIYPQWQGGIVNHWMPDLPADDVSRGYYLGAQLLNILAPPSPQKTAGVPISLDINDKEMDLGIGARKVIPKQARVTLELLHEGAPEKIVTLGGECSVNVVPSTYLAAEYSDDIAIAWIDAHPDINLPYDEYRGYHAMVLTACLGMDNEEILQLLPGESKVSNTLIVGLRSWDKGMKERQKNLGIKGLSPEEVAKDSSSILRWLKRTGTSKVVVHFDMDVIDPADMIAGVGVKPSGMKIDEVVRVINNIAFEYDLVGPTVVEPMPRITTKLRNMLDRLPLLK